MPLILALNPGSASLKFDVVALAPGQRYGCQGRKLCAGAIEQIGQRPARLSLFRGRETDRTEEVTAPDFAGATRAAFAWLRRGAPLEEVVLIGVRVVHGGEEFDRAAPADAHTLQAIERWNTFAPLHNQKSLDVIGAARESMPSLPIAVAFDTAFHRTMPEVAWRYPLPRPLAEKHRLRRYGFHGLSHRYMLERYAVLTGRPLDAINLVTLHLESGCSVTAIRNGVSVDNTMGVTPLEGLMMGTRSGSVDPSILPLLMEGEGISAEAALEILNKKSGLLGVSEISLDTRALMREYATSPSARLAMEMFCYRVRLAVGAYLAALGEAEAVVFGGGIGEDTPLVRSRVCAGLTGWGLELDEERNARTTFEEKRLSREGARLAAWSASVEEGLQIAWECAQLL